MALSFRTCEPEDIDQVLELWNFSAHGGSTNSTTALENRLIRDRDLFQLAWDENVLVGTLTGGWDGWRANMYRLAVRPDYRRRGIATELVRRVEQRLLDLGAVRVYALAVLESPEALRFWSALGYGPNSVITPLAKTLS